MALAQMHSHYWQDQGAPPAPGVAPSGVFAKISAGLSMSVLLGFLRWL